MWQFGREGQKLSIIAWRLYKTENKIKNKKAWTSGERGHGLINTFIDIGHARWIRERSKVKFKLTLTGSSKPINWPIRADSDYAATSWVIFIYYICLQTSTSRVFHPCPPCCAKGKLMMMVVMHPTIFSSNF